MSRKPLNVLVVDDNQINREVLARYLETAGHYVTVCTDGAHALDEFKRVRHQVVISDYKMDGMNGLELCSAIRKLGGNYTYFILITAHDEESVRAEMLASTVDDFLLKPYSPSTIRMRLRMADRILRHQERSVDSKVSEFDNPLN